MYHMHYFEILDTLIDKIGPPTWVICFTFYAKVEGVLENNTTGKDISNRDVTE